MINLKQQRIRSADQKNANSQTVMDIADEYLVKDELGDDKNAKLIDLVALQRKRISIL